MSFPRYPKYKDSGVEWLGEVPEHWEVCALKRIVSMQSGESITGESIKETGDYQVFGGNGLRGYASGFTHDGKFVLIGRQGALCGNINYASGKFWASEHAVVATPVRHVDTVWLGEMLRAMNLNQYSVAAAQPGLSVDLVGRLGISVPPLTEQTQIGTFLDRETAKIDELVAEQRRLMELLKEKRQAVISHAVTQGLNPDAPMKPSGIEWLGDVPEHWEVKRIKFVIQSVKAGPFGSALTKDVYASAGYRVYGQEQVIPNDFTIGDYFITPEKYEDLSQYSVATGDILISCVGTFGKIAIVPSDIEPGIINPRLIRLRCSKAIKAEYLVEVMRSNVTFEQFASFTRGGTMDVINIGTLNEIFVAVPPSGEQQQLLAFIHQDIDKFNALTAETQRAIDLLQERRTALISAAVTGQIDVRSKVTAGLQSA